MAKTAGMKIRWRIAPAGAQNRDGRSERAIGQLKKTLKHLHVSRDMNILEFQMIFKKAANCINERPLSTYDVHEGELPH